MVELFLAMFIGHLVGDFALQNDWMALNKKRFDVVGWSSAFVHCIVYTGVVMLFCIIAATNYLIAMQWYIFLFAFAIFMSHFIFDKFPLIENYMKIFSKQNWNTHLPSTPGGDINWNKMLNSKVTVQTIFGAIVYVALDQTAHLTLLYFIALIAT